MSPSDLSAQKGSSPLHDSVNIASPEFKANPFPYFARLRAEVEQAEAARRVAERALEHASFNVRALGDGGDRSAAPALAEAHAELTEVRAELDEVRAERDRLSAQLEEAHGRVREAERALGRLRRQARDEAAALRAGLERALATTQGDDLVPRRR